MTHEMHVLVGVDGSPASDAALAWAIELAGSRDGWVEALHAWQWDLGSLGVVVPDAPVALAVAAKHSVEAQVEKALADRPAGSRAVSVRARTAEGDAFTALSGAAAHADLLVLGRHGQAAWQRRLVGQTLGSVTGHCLQRSVVPVVVVPPRATVHPHRVVVGVDGSPASERALRWGLAHGRSLGLPVLALLTWQLTTLPAPQATRESWTVPPLSEWEQVARDLLAGTVARALPAKDVSAVEQVVLHRPAAAGLIETAGGTDLLVLGERGRGGFSRLLLGSVSRQCVEHARGVVVVVPPRDREAHSRSTSP